MGRRVVDYKTGAEVPEGADEASRALTEYSGILDRCSDPKETMIRLKDREITGMNARVTDMEKAVSKLTRELDEKEAVLFGMTSRMGEVDSDIKRLLGSYSWRLTKPLRWLSKLFKGEA